MKRAIRLFKRPVKAVCRRFPSHVKHAMANLAILSMRPEEKDLFHEIYQAPSIEWSLRNMRRLGFSPRRVLDVGAYVGNWTRLAKSIFTENYTQIHMVEAQPSKANSLKQVAEELVGVSYEISLVGDQTRITVPFFELETGSGVFEEQSSVPRQTRTYAMTTVDVLLANKGWESVDLLKIDVQGYELEVLKGASGTLSNTEAVLLEVSFIPINKGAPLIHEVIAFMQERGFQIYDICSLIRRPLDKALWQADLIFVDQESALLMRSTFD